MTSSALLLEIGSEEMPPFKIQSFVEHLKESLQEGFKNAGLTHGPVHAFCTPRRLAVLFENMAATQPNQTIERKGPNVAAAFNTDGSLTMAATGFLKSLNISLSDCVEEKTDKGTFLFYKTSQPGKSLAALLPSLVEQAIKTLPIPKSMRWGNHPYSFIRPVHWLVALHGQNILPLELLGLTAGRTTFGHRFHHKEPVTLHNALEYSEALQKTKVIADFDKRKKTIETLIHKAASALNAEAILSPDVLTEVTGLTEWPVVLEASFDKDFLRLPQEILICSMQTHQRYFPLQKNGSLLPHFIVISNTESASLENQRQGHERVVRARLSDAVYFYEKDLKTPLKKLFPLLGNITFQNKLGSYLEKIYRVRDVMYPIYSQCLNNFDDSLITTACELYKADLLTQVVGEFPELQGIMGSYYALNDDETVYKSKDDKSKVATAIREHYYPRFADDVLPSSDLGTLLALADRLDTLIGIFGIGLLPTGSKDPYALRRQAIAIIRIIIEKSLPLSLNDCIYFALNAYYSDRDGINPEIIHPETGLKVLEFLQERLKVYLEETRRFSTDKIQAVFAIESKNPSDILIRLEAVEKVAPTPEMIALAAAHKRVHNILNKNFPSGIPVNMSVNPDLFETPEETALWEALSAISEVAKPPYTEYLSTLVTLKNPLDMFFEKVLVMSDNHHVQKNRLTLLSFVHKALSKVADFSYLNPSKS